LTNLPLLGKKPKLEEVFGSTRTNGVNDLECI